jgi:hypothetical protein
MNPRIAWSDDEEYSETEGTAMQDELFDVQSGVCCHEQHADGLQFFTFFFVQHVRVGSKNLTVIRMTEVCHSLD